MSDDFVYLKPVEGNVVPRFGKPGSNIGHVFKKGDDGKRSCFVISNDVVRIPRAEFKLYQRAYQRAIDDEAIILSSKDEYDKYAESKSKASDAEAKKAAKAAAASDGGSGSEKGGKE